MTLIYNYILGYDKSDRTWFHNVDAEADLLNCNTVYNEKDEEYINEYNDGIYLHDAEQLIVKFNKAIDELNKNERKRKKAKK
jgi:hypothetical protein